MGLQRPLRLRRPVPVMLEVRCNPLVGHHDVAPLVGDLVEHGWSPAGRSSASLHLRCSALTRPFTQLRDVVRNLTSKDRGR
jgi:hypothetical protein